MRIEKYALPMYFGASISYIDRFVGVLSFRGKGEYSVLWAVIDESAELQKIEIMCIPTGEVWEKIEGEYLGTAEDKKGVEWHYFMKRAEIRK